MSSNSKESPNHSPLKLSPFKFGEYVSPNPRPIALGITYKPSPLVQFETSTTVKTESKPIPKEKIPNPNRENNSETNSPKNDENESKEDLLKEKLHFHQKELQTLQSQLDNLKLRNAGIDSHASTEEKETRLRIAFDPAVHIMNHTQNSLENSIDLTDKISSIRAKSDLTPYKPKTTQTRNQTETPENETRKQTRSDYRITPIPVRKKRVYFKSKLPSINAMNNDEFNKENIEINNVNNASYDGFETLKMQRSYSTPKLTTNRSFNLGKKKKDSSPSPNKPDSAHTMRARAPVVSTPILTPMKGSDGHNKKAFTFLWNKK